MGNAVEKRLASDKAMIGQHVGAVGHMLPTTKADFKVHYAVVAEQIHAAKRAFVWNRDLRQQILNQLIVLGTQLFTL